MGHHKDDAEKHNDDAGDFIDDDDGFRGRFAPEQGDDAGEDKPPEGLAQQHPHSRPGGLQEAMHMSGDTE